MFNRIAGILRSRIKDPFRRYLKYKGYIYPDISQYSKMSRFFHLKELFDKVENVKGDVVECGVALGYSLIILGTLAKQEGKGRKVYGFDSFEGFPEPSQFDKSFRPTKKGEHGHPLERVAGIIKKVDIPQPILVKGFVEDTLPGYKFPNGIAFLHIDTDIYSGYKASLDNLFDKVNKGGVIAFDEYNEPKWPGATKAINEFLEAKKQTIRKGRGINKYYVIKS